MQISNQLIPTISPILSTLISELGTECQNVTALIHQLQLPRLSPTQQAEILAELLAAAIHFQTHCGEDFQALIAEEMEKLPDHNAQD